jgi:hydrogenase maturation protease
MPSATLVLGLGNPLLGDDGVGWHVADRVRGALSADGAAPPGVDVDWAAAGGLSLMERMIGYERAIVVDAIATGDLPVGSVRRLALQDLPDPCVGHTGSAHDASLQTAVRLGRRLGAALPQDITIVAVEAGPIHEFCDTLSPAVAGAVAPATALVLAALGETSQP